MDHPLKVLLVASDVNTGADVRLIELKALGSPSKAAFVLRILREALTWRPDVVWCAHVNFSPVMLLVNRLLARRYLVALYGFEAIDISAFKRRVGEAVRLAAGVGVVRNAS